MKKEQNGMEIFFEAIIFRSRWILLPLYLGMVVGLGVFSIKFFLVLWDLIVNVYIGAEYQTLLLGVLSLVDKILVANLIIMVIISGYENSVSKIKSESIKNQISWLGKLDTGSLKVKLAISMVSISSVHLLTAFMNVKQTDDREMLWLVVIHATFVISALLLAFVDKLSIQKRFIKDKNEE